LKVLLIHPYCLESRLKDYDIKVVPIGLYYIGALLLSHGHEVNILNLYNFQNKHEEIASIIDEYAPEMIGLSVLQANRLGAAEIAKIAKTLNPNLRVVFGGVAANYLWRHFLENYPEVDYVIRGEGEETFLELANALSQNLPVSNIKGLAWRASKGIVFNGSRSFLQSIDSIPNPAKFFQYQHVVSSRGCPWNCTFCGSPRFWKRQVRFHSPTYFVDQLELLAAKNIKHFYVSDDTFTLDKKRVIQICKKILQRKLNISWVAISRVNLVDDEILYWMRRAGCIQISYGVESGSKSIRKIFKKNISDSEIEQAFHASTKMGILPRAYFIYGSPGENDSTINASIQLMKKIRPLSSVFYILDLFPGTELYEKFKAKFNISDDIWLKPIEDIMYFETDPNLTQEDVLKFGKMLRMAFYKNLPNFIRKIELMDKKELYPFHADFLSRLALTFTHGEYASIAEIPEKDKLAQELFKKALDYYPVERAFLGLAILLQKSKKFEDSVKVLKEGLHHFPASPNLNSCLGLSYLNLGKHPEALELFKRFPNHQNNRELIAYCEAKTQKH